MTSYYQLPLLKSSAKIIYFFDNSSEINKYLKVKYLTDYQFITTINIQLLQVGC